MTPGLLLGPHPCNPFCLGREPKARVAIVEVERFAQLGRDGQNIVIKHKEEEEGTEMGIELENETRKIVSFSCGGRLMFSQMDKF